MTDIVFLSLFAGLTVTAHAFLRLCGRIVSGPTATDSARSAQAGD